MIGEISMLTLIFIETLFAYEDRFSGFTAFSAFFILIAVI